jgi:hypothetical protein
MLLPLQFMRILILILQQPHLIDISRRVSNIHHRHDNNLSVIVLQLRNYDLAQLLTRKDKVNTHQGMRIELVVYL